jgi:hypothetical protein
MANIDDEVLSDLASMAVSAIAQGQFDDITEMRSNSNGTQIESAVAIAPATLNDRTATAVVNDCAANTRPADSKTSAPNEAAEAHAELLELHGEEHSAQSAITPARSNEHSNDGTVAEALSQTASPAVLDGADLHECAACSDEKDSSQIIRVPCRHEYCGSCLEYMFVQSIQDEAVFPPRCDKQEIPLSLVKDLLPREVKEGFEARYDELSTKVRTYCFESKCAAWIPPADIVGEIGTCPQCKETTCTTCKKPSHTGDCVENQAEQLLHKLAIENHWQKCYQCKTIIEVNMGCNHMT